MSVYKKLSTIQAAMRSLAANAEGQTGQAKYGYVSGSKLLGFLRPLMDKEHLILSQEVVDIKNEPISYMTRNGEKTEMFTTLKIRFTWIDSEDETTLVNEFYANGMNAWDKGLGSALTYAERYYLMKFFHIATDEDDIDAQVKDEAINPTGEPAPAPAPRTRKPATRTAKQQLERNYIPMDEEKYWKCVAAYAQGKTTTTGGDIRDFWIKQTNADAEAISKWDYDVESYIFAHTQQ
jgi:hypothetical protein